MSRQRAYRAQRHVDASHDHHPAADVPAAGPGEDVPRAILIATLIAVGAICTVSEAEAHGAELPSVIHQIDHKRMKTQEIRRTLGRRPVPVDFSYRTSTSRADKLGTLLLWHRRLVKARKLTPHPTNVWARLAECESGGQWSYNGSVIYDGGLQFHPQTWAAHRKRKLPKHAWQATPYQQIVVAKRVQAAQGWSAWPSCSRKLGLR